VEREDIESQGVTRDSLVSPGDSAVPARSFALVREIMDTRTHTGAARGRDTPDGRVGGARRKKYAYHVPARRGYSGENKIRADVGA